MQSYEFPVEFGKGRNGSVITKVEGKIAFPEKNGNQPQVGETWLVRKSGENNARTVIFLKLICKVNLYGVVCDDGAFWTNGSRLIPSGLPENREDGWEYRPYAESSSRNSTNTTYWTLASKLEDNTLIVVRMGQHFGSSPKIKMGYAFPSENIEKFAAQEAKFQSIQKKEVKK